MSGNRLPKRRLHPLRDIFHHSISLISTPPRIANVVPASRRTESALLDPGAVSCWQRTDVPKPGVWFRYAAKHPEARLAAWVRVAGNAAGRQQRLDLGRDHYRIWCFGNV